MFFSRFKGDKIHWKRFWQRFYSYFNCATRKSAKAEADGVSPRLDGRRGRVLGNAVVPAIAEWIGRKTLEIESMG
ncbi:hypothetical protein AM228_10790 [Planktothricoides sp. SR001]|nr:hypothetical protein AM228_10790 [Planktothricoides sp. SR001]